MRVLSVVISPLLLLLLMSSCIREPFCEELSKEENVTLLPQWPDSGSRPATVFVRAYPGQSGEVLENFIPSTGGSIYLPGGEYQLLLYSNTSARIRFRGMETLSTAEAYADAGTQPDELYQGSVPVVKISDRGYEQEVLVPMKNLVYAYPFTYSGVIGLQYVSSILVSVDGINLAVNLGSGTPLATTSVVNCPYRITTDGVEGMLHCFGHGGENTKHSFVIRFEYGRQSLVRTYDVTAMLNTQGRIDIHDNIVFEPLEQGDVDTGVDNWEDNVVDVPINP